MIYGRFGNSTGRPYLGGLIAIKRLKLKANVSFLIDTGADRTVLMPIDGARMSVPYNNLPNKCKSNGVGGEVEDSVENAHVAIYDADGFIYTYFVQLIISTPTPENQTLPSLLGRDIIGCWSITIAKPQNIVTAEALTFFDKKETKASIPEPTPLLG